MRCKKAQQAFYDAKSRGCELHPAVEKHVAQCRHCAEFAQAAARLDDILNTDEPVAPRPGFDTRFFSMLEDVKTGRSAHSISTSDAVIAWFRRWRWALIGASSTAAVAVALVARQPHERSSDVEQLARIGAQDLGVARDMEMVQDLDLVQKLQDVETYEMLAQIDLDDLEGPEQKNTVESPTSDRKPAAKRDDTSGVIR
jgi:hypothetical protein